MNRSDELRARLEEDPTDEAALDALLAEACAAQDWSLAASALRQRVDIAGDVPTRIRALTRLASIAEDQLDDLEAAASAYEVILELDPSAVDAAQSLARIRQALGG